MSEGTLKGLLKGAGYKGRHVPYGFCAAFSTIMIERAYRQWREGWTPRRQVARPSDNRPDAGAHSDWHVGIGNSLQPGAYMPRRRELAQEWADMLLADFWPAEKHLGKPIRYAATGAGRP